MNSAYAILMVLEIPPGYDGFILLLLLGLVLGSFVFALWFKFGRDKPPVSQPQMKAEQTAPPIEPNTNNRSKRQSFDHQTNVARQLVNVLRKLEPEVTNLHSDLTVRGNIHEIRSWFESDGPYPTYQLFTLTVNAGAPKGFEILVSYRNGDESRCGVSETEIAKMAEELRERIRINKFAKRKQPLAS